MGNARVRLSLVQTPRQSREDALMTYIEKHLNQGETIVRVGRFHWLWYARAWAALIIFGWLIVGLIYFIYEMIRLITTEFAVTDRRLIRKTGFIAANVDQMSLEAIEGASLRQGVIGRIFGFGNLDIDGRGEGEVDFPIMAAPAKFLKAVNEARSAAERAAVDRLAEDISHR
ncbi:PH domain-containing protein [Henriciella algicola]|uniref:PH domain-containing protein n=2 Tax=Henriciella algicola TaxID=1608422 RepID=A0A399RCH3_9PROT|nr:PH domain-containing protein [Henriciella algicola]